MNQTQFTDRLTNALIRFAGRRWPASIRDERVREWTAELHQLRTDASLGEPARALRQLRFAASLAWSPPVEDEHGVPRGWREMLPGLDRSLRPILALTAGAVLTVILPEGMGLVSLMLPGIPDPSNPDSGIGPVLRAVYIVSTLLAVFLAGLLGRALGRRVRPGLPGRRPIIGAGPAILAAIVTALTVAGINEARIPDSNTEPGPDSAAGALTWLLILTPALIAATRHAARGRRLTALFVGTIGSLLALDAAAIATGLRLAISSGLDVVAAPLWMPIILLGLQDTELSLGNQDGGAALFSSSTVLALTCGTTYVFWYGIHARRTARKPVAEPQPVANLTSTATPQPASVAAPTLWPFERPMRTALLWLAALFGAVPLSVVTMLLVFIPSLYLSWLLVDAAAYWRQAVDFIFMPATAGLAAIVSVRLIPRPPLPAAPQPIGPPFPRANMALHADDQSRAT